MRENVCEQVMISFGLTFDLLRKWGEFLNHSPSVETQTNANANDFQHSSENHSKRGNALFVAYREYAIRDVIFFVYRQTRV